MTDYIHHTANVIDVAPRALPISWGNVSGLGKATPGELKDLGWLPVVYINRDYNEATQVRTGPVGGQIGDSASGANVQVTYSIRAKTPQELSAEKDAEAAGVLGNRQINALIASLNDGSFIPGSNYTQPQIQAILKAKL